MYMGMNEGMKVDTDIMSKEHERGSTSVDQAIFEGFHIEGSSYLTGVNITTYKTVASNDMASVKFIVVGADENGPNLDQVIYEQDVNINNFKDLEVNYVVFDDAVEVEGDIYIGIQYSDATEDTFVVFSGDAGDDLAAYTLNDRDEVQLMSDDAMESKSLVMDVVLSNDYPFSYDDDDMTEEEQEEEYLKQDLGRQLSGLQAYDEEVEVFDFEVFPNPASNFISFTVYGQMYGARIFVYNILGEMVMEIHPSQIRYVDVSILETGLYFVNITNGVENITKQFRVE